MPLRGRQLIIDYHQKFGDEQGARILQDLRKSCQFDLPITCTDPIALGIKVGETNLIKHIYKKLKQDPNALTESTKINITSETGE